MKRIFAAIVFLGVLCQPAFANSFTKRDVAALSSVVEHYRTFMGDLVQKQAAFIGSMVYPNQIPDFSCLSDLLISTETQRKFLEEIYLSAAIDSVMVDPRDDARVASMASLELKDYRALLKSGRDDINTVSGVCADNALVQSKSQRLLDLDDKARAVLDPIVARIGTCSTPTACARQAITPRK